MHGPTPQAVPSLCAFFSFLKSYPNRSNIAFSSLDKTAHERLDNGANDCSYCGVHVGPSETNVAPFFLNLFSRGGLEMLFSDQRKHKISVPATDAQGQPANVAFLVQWLCENLMKDPRKEMFVLDDAV